MESYGDARVRQVNGSRVDPSGRFVLYWMQAYRRLDHNHALDRAIAWSRQLSRPLVVYEGLRVDYPWASDRFHRFILEGMQENARRAAEAGVNYWPYVQTPDQPASGLLRRIAANACLVVTDDFPAFIAPRQTQALALRLPISVEAVDGNSVVPLAKLGPVISAAAHLRPRIHREFAQAWTHRATAEPDFSAAPRQAIDAPFPVWRANDLDALIAGLPIDHAVGPVKEVPGGSGAAKAVLRDFLRRRLRGYADRRSHPAPPEQGHASCLSPYLHFGHISIEEVAAAVLGKWDPSRLNASARGKREGFFHADADVNAFLDEALTWRDVGYQWHRHRTADVKSLKAALPGWALDTLTRHAEDRRPHLYTAEQLEAADTHDPLWNAAQTELVETGRMHNYLRMLWGKKVIEWTASPDDAYRILEHLNNKYALDGRDPNSYTGILWCFGLFDRPWPPERPVFGTVRYMSSDNTARKFKLAGYLEYIGRLGRAAGRAAAPATLFDSADQAESSDR
jgi:deoxyribodipyrimidine photo-lyase